MYSMYLLVRVLQHRARRDKNTARRQWRVSRVPSTSTKTMQRRCRASTPRAPNVRPMRTFELPALDQRRCQTAASVRIATCICIAQALVTVVIVVNIRGDGGI